MSSSSSVCYIVPNFSMTSAAHFAHIPRFLSELGQYCEVHAIFLQGEGNPTIPNVASVHVLKSTSYRGRFLELIGLARQLRRNGCRKFFVRISPSAAFTLGVLSRFMDIQVYYWNSGDILDVEKSWRNDFRRWLNTTRGRIITSLNIKLAHKLVTGPEGMVNYYVRWFGVTPRDVIVLYNDVDIRHIVVQRRSYSNPEARAFLGIPQDIPVVFSVGRISYLKGGHNIVPIAKLLAERNDALFLVAGQTHHMPGVVAEAQGLKNLRLCGAVPNNELYRYFIAADVFVLRSESEGFSRSLLEAMAYGLPVVAFDVGGVKDIVDPRQLPFVVPRRDVATLVDKISLLLAQPTLREQQSQIGLERAQRYSTKRVARMFYDRIVCD